MAKIETTFNLSETFDHQMSLSEISAILSLQQQLTFFKVSWSKAAGVEVH